MYGCETGLCQQRARHYDPALGRFLQSDPLGFAAGDLNLYAYTWNDPQNWTDPSGLAPTASFASLTAGAARLSNGPFGHVAAGTLCLANKVSTYLTALGDIRENGGDFSKIDSFKLAECVIGAVAPPPCRCKGRTGSSFAEGTEVLTPEGSVPIETLREGDLVVARDDETGQTGVFPVTAVMSREATDLLWLTLVDGHGATSTLGITSEHPLFVVGEGWLTADEVVAGDAIRDAKLRPLTVLSVAGDRLPKRVHNLEVAEASAYFAGQFEAWGHNIRAAGPKRSGCKGSRYVPVWLKKKLVNDPRTPRFIKGWYKQQRNAGVPWSRTKNPPGFDFGHSPTNPYCLGGRHGGGSGFETAGDNRGRGGRTRR